ncbi:hypothetical protein HXX76_008242 [Chlamydomonas incerta]|uniref:Smr domain-containing protein n=1 Tax=Chlamydomonas incerta TaxID=51695 RepID=A0A835W1U6_CHLIN|nr:hypothetical protein HXX76_008242 [Chlamydomonas incerta]|eukprot:KAG2433889.1 hypothetical protein HXX76_008242 [Chlamydomonas incerta]
MGNASSGRSADPAAARGDPSRPEYWRAQGDAHAQARNAAFAASKEAYRLGDHARAGQLSREGKQHAAQCNEAHERAAALVLAQHNTGRTPGELDLHGLRVKEAVAEVEKAIAAARAANPPQQRLVLIVGKGLHSADGVPKLKPAIEGLVRRHNLRVTPGVPNAGCILVEFVKPSERGWVGDVVAWLTRGACVIC